MVLNLNKSNPLNILVLLSPLIYHGLLTSNQSTLKLVKLLKSSTVISIRCFSLYSSHFISLSCHAPLFGTHPYLPLMLKFSRKPKNFALKMCSHKWDNDYSSLLSTFNLPTLSTRRSISKLCLHYKITNNLLYFPSDIFIRKPLPSYASHHFDPLTFTIPFSRSSASQNYLSLLFSLCGTHFLIM